MTAPVSAQWVDFKVVALRLPGGAMHRILANQRGVLTNFRDNLLYSDKNACWQLYRPSPNRPDADVVLARRHRSKQPAKRIEHDSLCGTAVALNAPHANWTDERATPLPDPANVWFGLGSKLYVSGYSGRLRYKITSRVVSILWRHLRDRTGFAAGEASFQELTDIVALRLGQSKEI